MAKSLSTPTRRGILGVITAAPLLTLPTAATASPGAFPAYLAEYRNAHTEFERICVEDYNNAGPASAACWKALDTLIRTPAPDFASATTKLETLVEAYRDAELPEDLLAFIIRDMQRLSFH